MAVTVLTTTGTEYEVPSGVSWTEMVSPTGELAIQVFALPEAVTGDDDLVKVASFGSVETVYSDGTVTVVTAPAAAPLPAAAVKPWA